MEKKPDIVGFSCCEWNITNILKVAKAIKHAKNAPILILGGPEVSPRSEEILRKEKYIDIIVRGEGEESFKELTESLVYGKIGMVQIRGISYRIKEKVFRAQDRPAISNLDSISSPYLEGLIDLKMYPNNLHDVPTETMRGCIYRCHYCYYHKDFKGLRYFSLRRIEMELRYILAKGPLRIYFMDPTFDADPKRAKKILRLFVKYNKKSKLHLELKAELLDEEMIMLLHRANADYIEIGVQSTNQKSLKLINRTLNRRVFKRNISLLNKYGINYQLHLIDSLPGDTYNDLKRSLDWILSLHPPLIKIMKLRVLPGTYLARHAKRFGIICDSTPPYFSHKSNTMSMADLERVEQLRIAIVDLISEAWVRRIIYLVKNKLSINFSDIFEEYDGFKEKVRASTFTSRFNRILRFTKYLYDEYGQSRGYESIRRSIIFDILPLIRAYAIAKKKRK